MNAEKNNRYFILGEKEETECVAINDREAKNPNKKNASFSSKTINDGMRWEKNGTHNTHT